MVELVEDLHRRSPTVSERWQARRSVAVERLAVEVRQARLSESELVAPALKLMRYF